MRTLATFVFFAVVAFGSKAGETNVNLPRFGALPIPSGWRVLDRGSYGDTNQPSYWVVLQKADKPEYLSFYAFGPPRSQITNAITFTDTAHEIFPDGHIARSIKPPKKYSTGPSIWPLHSGLAAVASYEALEYSFISDFDGRSDNLIAHGYVLFGDFAMIVQHTSDRPTTPEFVWGVAEKTMRTLFKISAPKNLKTK